MVLGFRALFVRLGASVILAVASAMGISLWASGRAEQALREERVSRLLVAVETGPLQMARMQSRALANEQLDALMTASNDPDALFLGLDIRSGPEAGQELASWAAPFSPAGDGCIERRLQTRSFSDGIFPYHVTLTFDRCGAVSGFQQLRWTLIAASLVVSLLIMLSFWQAFDPVLRSLRAAARSLASPDGAKRNVLPFEPVEQLLAIAERTVRAEKEAALAHVTRNIFHDLKTPLVAFERIARVRNWTEFSALQGGLESSLARLHAMVDALRRSDLELVVRPNICTMDPRIVLDNVRPLAAEHLVEVVAGCDSIRCQIDLPKVERALINLLRNAIESGAHQVELRVRSHARTLLIEVSDDGPGVPNALALRLFEKGATSGKAGGLGLGLAYARNVARGHGGDATYERQGGRSVFLLALPDALELPELDAGAEVRLDAGSFATQVGTTLVVLLADADEERSFAENALSFGFSSVSMDPAFASAASAIYVDSARLEALENSIAPGVPILVAGENDDVKEILSRLQKRARHHSKGVR